GVFIMASAPSTNMPSAAFCASAFSKYSPVLNPLVSTLLINVLKPSSIQAYFLSLEPTINGNQLWPNSWSVTSHSPPSWLSAPQNTMPGYSMPRTVPATLVATG